MNWSRIGIDRWVASDYLERIGVPVEGTLVVTPYSQNDPRWKNVRLGTSSTTIGWNGCLLDCHAMIAKFYGKDTDPARLNTWLTANNGYENRNLFVWSAFTRCYPDIVMSLWVDCYSTPAPLSQLDAALARGEPCVVWVDFNPPTAVVDMHWVTIIGKLGADDYTFIDSWDGWRGSFKSRYVDPSRYIYRIVSYKKS